jgi:hypothetical protein
MNLWFAPEAVVPVKSVFDPDADIDPDPKAVGHALISWGEFVELASRSGGSEYGNFDYRNEWPSQHGNHATVKGLDSGRSPRHGDASHLPIHRSVARACRSGPVQSVAPAESPNWCAATWNGTFRFHLR